MKIDELHKRLTELHIPEWKYYLQGLYGSTDDEGKISLSIHKGQYSTEYKTYYKERGEKSFERLFLNEDEACEEVYKKLIYEWLLLKMNHVYGLSGMTINERLYSSGLIKEFDQFQNDKVIIKQILKLLKVDRESIDKIIKRE